MKKLLTLLSLLSLLIFCHCGAEEVIDELFIDISGNVSDDGQPVGGAVIILLDSPNLTDGVSLSNASISNADGSYVVINVQAGDYYVVAIDDMNDNFEYDMGTDRIGFHGVDPGQLDLAPDQVSVSMVDVEGIDITYFAN
ncbi:MAG: carboxypeptidase-like regulatory domain-containing protein [Bacteroidota bacterium]